MSTTVKESFDAIIVRLQAILVASGYNTNAGREVYRGVRFFQDDDVFPLLTVFSGDEVIEKLTYNEYRSTRIINIEGYVQDADTPTIGIEQLIEDVQEAMEQTDVSLGGLVEVLDYTGIEEVEPPLAGSDISGVRITYEIVYRRQYGA